MRARTGSTTRSMVCRIRPAPASAAALSMLLAAGAWAQSSPCDDYKAVLAARFESAGVRGYSLEVVPASAPVPPGAKVIATCEGGARKFVYRRWGAARPSTSVAAPAASDVQAAAVAADKPAQRAPSDAPQERVSKAVPASAPATILPPAPRAKGPAAALAVTAAEAAKPVLGGASELAAANPVEGRVVAPPEPAKAEMATDGAVTLTQRAARFGAAHWQWIGAFALVALAGGLWLWRRYFSAYDKDGLPRGPTL